MEDEDASNKGSCSGEMQSPPSEMQPPVEMLSAPAEIRSPQEVEVAPGGGEVASPREIAGARDGGEVSSNSAEREEGVSSTHTSLRCHRNQQKDIHG